MRTNNRHRNTQSMLYFGAQSVHHGVERQGQPLPNKKGARGPFQSNREFYHQVAYKAAKIKVTAKAEMLKPVVVANWISSK